VNTGITELGRLKDQALALPGLDHRGLECSHNRLSLFISTLQKVTQVTAETYLVKDVLETLLRQRRTLDVLNRTELACETVTRLRRHRSLLLACKLVHYLRVVTQIDLGADYEARHTGAMVPDLGEPLLLDVLKRGWRGHAETHEEDVRLRVRERPESVVILLT
jgi:hypothetical protein